VHPRPYVVACVLALTACTGEVRDPGTPPPRTSSVATPTIEACPSATTSPKENWPKDVPSVVPRPAGLEVQRVDTSQGNVTQVRAIVPMSVREGLQWIVRELPKAGFTLGRGDAEATEVDAPFVRGDALRGLVRVFLVPGNQCQTLWLYAVVRNTNAPYELGYTPPPSSTPLPFG
jgi:hypothetical protein